MKSRLFLKIGWIWIAVALADPLSLLAEDTTYYQERISEVQALEEKNDFAGAYVMANQLIRRMHKDLRIGEVVENLKMIHEKVLQQVVTSRFEDHFEKSSSYARSEGFSFKFLPYFKIGQTDKGSGETQGSKHTWSEHTAWIEKQPGRSIEFRQQVESKQRELKEKLTQYISNQGQALLIFKGLGIVLLRNAYYEIRAGKRTQVVTLEEMNLVYALLTQVEFMADMNLILCEEKRFTSSFSGTISSSDSAYKRSFTQSGSVWIPWVASLSGRTWDRASSSSHESSSTQFQQFAHTAKSCSEETVRLQMDPSGTFLAINFGLLDRALAQWHHLVEAAVRFGNLNVREDRNFGVPSLTPKRQIR